MTDVRVLLLDAVQDAVQALDKSRQKAAVKRIIAYAWGLLPVEDRQAFLQRVSAGDNLDLVGWSPKFPRKDDPNRSRVDRDVEEAARTWGLIHPELARADLDMGSKVQKVIRIRRTPNATMQRFMRVQLAEWKRRREAVHSQSEATGGKV